MTEEVKVGFKMCFLGDSGVGKTSLIRRYIYEMYEDSYLMTMGTKVSKKNIIIEKPEYDKKFNITLMIWDIMGDIHFRGVLHHSYFYGAKGAFIVYDITRPETLENITDWVESLHREIDGKIPIIFMANKVDLNDGREIEKAIPKKLAETYNARWLLTSAKTGANVENAFSGLANKVLEDYLHNMEIYA